MMNMIPKISRRGFMLVLSSPSGAGKTSISREILNRVEDIELSISLTTRPMRPGEENGKDYHFVHQETFKDKVNKGDLLEYAHVFSHYYGTPKAEIYQKLKQGIDVLFDIEWQGTQQLKQAAREDVVSIFILPPSMQALEERLKNRAQDTESVVKERMEMAEQEVSHWPEYDYVLVNHDFEKSINDVKSILLSERLKRERQPGLPEFVNKLRHIKGLK